MRPFLALSEPKSAAAKGIILIASHQRDIDRLFFIIIVKQLQEVRVEPPANSSFFFFFLFFGN